jgi:hypothetical protein
LACAIRRIIGHSKDLVWVLLRQVHRPIMPGIVATTTQTIPFWTGFNTSTGTPATTKTIALYNDDHAVEVARKFVSSLYDQGNKLKAHHGSLNDLRIKMSTTKAISVPKLPPCEASLQHVKRAAWQCLTWTTVHGKLPQIPSKMLDSTFQDHEPWAHAHHTVWYLS